jgi:DNA-binding PadR family transcriptional regulator
LVERGYATVENTSSGARTRTAYEVTDAGKEALEAWLAEPESKPFGLEYERMLKFIFCGVAAQDDGFLGRSLKQGNCIDDLYI